LVAMPDTLMFDRGATLQTISNLRRQHSRLDGKAIIEAGETIMTGSFH
jgi:hypothetical protein